MVSVQVLRECVVAGKVITLSYIVVEGFTEGVYKVYVEGDKNFSSCLFLTEAERHFEHLIESRKQ